MDMQLIGSDINFTQRPVLAKPYTLVETEDNYSLPDKTVLSNQNQFPLGYV